MKIKQTTTLKGFPLGGFTLRPFAGDEVMLVRVEGTVGALAPAHAHPHEQMSLVISGRIRFRMLGEERELGPGEALHIPSGTEHEALVLEELVMYEIFHPVREDFLALMES